MKRIVLVTLFSTWGAFAQTPCDSGMAGAFPCDGYDLIAQLPLQTFNADSGNDSWGWTDPLDGKEYVVMGLNNGTAFIDISDPINPLYLGKLPSNGSDGFRDTWRDVKVANNVAYIVSEIVGHGLQIFDLTKLRDVTNPPEIFTADALYTGFSNAHNVVVNEDTNFVYSVGTNTFSGGPHFVDVTDPFNPVAAGGHSGDGYSHDAQVVLYNGPDPDYQGKEIYAGSNQDRVVFVDITDKNNPQSISNVSYNNVAYTHQGWFTEDQKYFVVTDEIDEINFGNPMRLIILDVTDLDAPVVHMEYLGETPAVDHNAYVKGDKIYVSAYTAGMRVLDISDIDNKNITEIGFFDTWPANDNTSASVGDPGAWNVYPFFESDLIVVTNYSDDGGFFLVADDELVFGVPEQRRYVFTAHPNPSEDFVLFESATHEIYSIAIYDVTGKLIKSLDFLNGFSQQVDVDALAPGMYIALINKTTAIRLLKN